MVAVAGAVIVQMGIGVVVGCWDGVLLIGRIVADHGHQGWNILVWFPPSAAVERPLPCIGHLTRWSGLTVWQIECLFCGQKYPSGHLLQGR